MSHSISSLAWLQRAATVASSSGSGGGRSERGQAATAAPVAAAAPVTPVQQLSAVVQTAVTADSGTAPKTTASDPSATVTGSAEADTTVQRFAQALLVALHRAGRGEGRGDHSGDELHHRHGGHHGDHHGDHGHGRDHEGLRAYRSMNSMAQRLGDLATQLRQGATAPGTGAPAPAATAAPVPATPITQPVNTPDASSAGSTPVQPATTATPATGTAPAPTVPPRADPLQRLLDAFSALTTAPAGGSGTSTPASNTASPARTPGQLPGPAGVDAVRTRPPGGQRRGWLCIQGQPAEPGRLSCCVRAQVPRQGAATMGR